MAIDLGEGRKIMPSCYSIINRFLFFFFVLIKLKNKRNLNTHVLLNWVLEGSLDN